MAAAVQITQPPRVFADPATGLAPKSASKTANVIVFSDHPVFRSSLAWKIDGGSGVRVIADAASLHETLTLAAEFTPDAIVADMRVGDGNSEGVESVATLARKHDGIPVIVNSDFYSRAYLARMMDAGATAVMPKSASTQELVMAIRDAVAGSRSKAASRDHSAA